MNRIVFIILFVFLAATLLLTACDKQESMVQTDTPSPSSAVKISASDLVSLEDKASYGMGYDMGKKFKELGFHISADIFSTGLRDGIEETDSPLLTEEEIKQAMKDFQQEIRKKKKEEMDKKAVENKEKSDKFLEENKKKEGVVTLESGLQYLIVTDGSGETPKATDRVKVHYKGTTIDGTEFDSSYKRNKPATFSVNRVVKGWTEALQLMKVGSKWQLFVPPELGYGNRGAGRKIGPNETLIFDIELISIEEAVTSKTEMPQTGSDTAPKTK